MHKLTETEKEELEKNVSSTHILSTDQAVYRESHSIMQQEQNMHRLNVLKDLPNTATAEDKKAMANSNNYKYKVEIYITENYDNYFLDGDVDQLLSLIEKKLGRTKTHVMQTEAESATLIAKIEKKKNDEKVMDYVKRFLPAIFPDKHESWMAMWQTMIADKDLQNLIFCPGKQKFKDFNKNGVANIVSTLIDGYPALFKENKSNIAKIVEGSKNNHMRIELGRARNVNKVLTNKIKEKYINKFLFKKDGNTIF